MQPGDGSDGEPEGAERSALDRLNDNSIRHLYHAWRKYALRLTASAEQADELVQDCYCALREKSATELAGVRSWEALGRRIIYNKWMDRCRRQRRRLRHDQATMATELAVGNLATRHDLRRLIGAEYHRPDVQAFVWYILVGKDYAQLAAELGVTVETARKRVSRGRLRIQAAARQNGYKGSAP